MLISAEFRLHLLRSLEKAGIRRSPKRILIFGERQCVGKKIEDMT